MRARFDSGAEEARGDSEANLGIACSGFAVCSQAGFKPKPSSLDEAS